MSFWVYPIILKLTRVKFSKLFLFLTLRLTYQQGMENKERSR